MKILLISIIICCLLVGTIYIGIQSLSIGSTCEDCFHLDGYFSAIKEDGQFIVVNGHDYYISDWFKVDGRMPYYINDYVGHNVSIDYMAGCGRRYITSFELVLLGEISK